MNLRKLIENAPKAIHSNIRCQHFPKGSHILLPDEKNSYLYLLLSGQAEVYLYTMNGTFLSLYRYHENNCFGEIELFSPQRTTLGIIACTDCEAAVLTRETTLQWANSNKEFCAFLLEQMAIKIAENSDSYIRSSAMTLKEQVLYCLYRHYQLGTLDTLDKTRLTNEVCTPIRSLNRVLAQCREDQLIEYKNHYFHIKNSEALSEIVDSLL